MLRRVFLLLLLLTMATFAGARTVTSFGGFDTGMTAVEMLKRVEESPGWFGGAVHPWLRIRGLIDPRDAAQSAKVTAEVAALARLKTHGFNCIALLRWDERHTPGGVRAGGGPRVPLDLREAYSRAMAYGRAYGGVTAFEVDNEPDISFVEENAETYAAFLKACYLGFKAGAAETTKATPEPRAGWRKFLARLWNRREGSDRASEPWVVMAPLALPPGPYFERFVANDALNYTDAFNYHYYGYAEDFTRTYRQFENGLATLAPAGAKRTAKTKRLPILITEYGYGSLTDVTRNTVEGRLQQWRWFKSVGTQLRDLRLEGPMAFYLPPYLELGVAEFGLTAPAVSPAKPATSTTSSTRGFNQQPRTEFMAGGLSYRATDLSTAERGSGDQVDRPSNRTPMVAPWMRRIGHAVGSSEATPALAWLTAESARHPYVARDWLIAAEAASSVVLDFVGRQRMIQLKRYNGYMVQGSAGTEREGSGELIVYNFSSSAVRGLLQLKAANGLRVRGVPTGTIELAAGARLVLAVTVSVQAQAFTAADCAWSFEVEGERPSLARFTTAFFPEATTMEETVLTRFDASVAASSGNRQKLAARTLAGEEVPSFEQGRWRVTAGVSVAETPGGDWRFEIAAFPNGRPRPCVAELPLADGFAFPDGGMLRLLFRLAEPAGTTLANARYCEVYFRTANGNLYEVWPRLRAFEAWSEYTEVKENFTMGFYSRANLPWRFAENRPVALVIWLRPATAPAVYEIKDARIVKLGK